MSRRLIQLVGLALLCGALQSRALFAEDGAPSNGEPSSEAAAKDLAKVSSAAVESSAASAAAKGIRIVRLSLSEAIRTGVQANLGLLAASYDTPIAHQGRIAADASFDYLLTGNLSYNQEEFPITNIFQGVGVNQNKSWHLDAGISRRLRSGGSVALLYRADRLSTNNPFALVNPAYTSGVVVEASQPLLRGAGDIALADIRRAQNDVVAARAGYESNVEQTLLAMVSAYWELGFADENLDARRKSEEVARELLSDAQSRLNAEVGTPLDVAEARAGVERRVSEVLQAENLRGTVQDQLLQLIMPFGHEVRAAVHIVPTSVSRDVGQSRPTLGDEKRYVGLALKGRPELRQMRAQIATRGIDVFVARDAIRPQLDVVGSLGTQGLDDVFRGGFRNLMDAQAVSGGIGLQFSLFLGQRAARSDWLAAAWRRRQTMVQYKDLENQIVVEVRAALRNLDTAAGQLKAADAEVAAGLEALVGERLRLEQGKSTPFRVLQKEQDLTDARARFGRAAADLRTAEAGLWRAVGALADNLGVDAEHWDSCDTCR